MKNHLPLRKSLLCSVIFVLLGLLLASHLLGSNHALANNSPQLPSTQGNMIAPTESPTRTVDPAQVNNYSYTTSTNQTTRTPTTTPVPWGKSVILPENAKNVKQRAVWGLGIAENSALTKDGKVYILATPFGIYIYRSLNMELIKFLPEAQEFFLSAGTDTLFTRLPDGEILVVRLPDANILYRFEPIALLTHWMKEDIYAHLPNDRQAVEERYYQQVTRITALTTSTDNRLVAIGFGDASIGLWNLTNGKLVRILKNEIVSEVSELVFSPNSEKLISTNGRSNIAAWQVAEGRLLWRLPGIGHIVGQPFSPDGSLLAIEITKGSTSWVSVRNTIYGDELGPKVVGALAADAISPDNTRLVTTWHGSVTIWSIPGLQQIGKIQTNLEWPRASFSVDGKHILLNNGQQAYWLGDLKQDTSYSSPKAIPTTSVKAESLIQARHLPRPLGVRFPKQDEAYTWGLLSETIAWVYNLSDERISLHDFGSSVMADPDLSPSGELLAACTDEGLIVIHLADGQESNFGRCFTTGVVRFSMDDKIIFRASYTKIDALNSADGTLLYSLRVHSFLVESLEVTSDGQYLVSSSNFQYSRGRELIWWRLDPPSKLYQWMESVMPYNQLFAACVDKNKSVLYAALGGLRGWRLADGLPQYVGTGRTTSLAISPDNRLLAMGDAAGYVHILSLDNWKELVVLSGHRQAVTRLVFSPDSTGLLSASADGTIRLWGSP